jgi:ACT domain-containing protein
MNTTQKLIRNKIGLINLAGELKNISKACNIMGLSRQTFYRYQELMNEGGIENLIDRTRRKPNLKNRVEDTVELKVIEFAMNLDSKGYSYLRPALGVYG